MKKVLDGLINNRFVRGGSVLMITSFVVGFLNYLFNSLSGKFLGPGGYAEIAAYAAYLTIFSIPIQVITADLIRRLGQKGEKKLSYLKNWEKFLISKIFKWGFLFIPYFLSSFIVKDFLNLTLPFTLTLFFVLAASFISVFYLSSLQGIHAFFWYSFIVVFATLVKLTGPILVYLKIDGLLTIALFLGISAFIPILLGKIILGNLLKKIIPADKTSYQRISSMFFNKSILILFLTFFFLNFLNNIDVVIVKKLFSQNVAGLYGAWSLFAKMIFYLAGPLIAISYIFFSDIDQKKTHLKGLTAGVFMIFIFGIVMFFVYKTFGNFLILLIFNEKYLSISQYLPLAALFGTSFTLINVLSAYFIARGSTYTLISVMLIPFYIFFLFLSRNSISTIMIVTVTFSILISILLIVVAIISASNENKTKKQLLKSDYPCI